jgi:hypothetical protein
MHTRTHEGVHKEKNQKKGAGLRPLCFAVEGLAPLASIAHPPPMEATAPSMSVKGWQHQQNYWGIVYFYTLFHFLKSAILTTH